MQLPRKVISAVSSEIAPAIKSFLKANSDASAQGETKVDQGNTALAHAIAFGIAKAFASNGFITAMAACIIPPGGGPLTPPPMPIVQSSSIEV